MLLSKVDSFTCAVRSDVDDHDKPVPLRCVTGPPELVDSVHPARSAAPTPTWCTAPIPDRHMSPSQQPRVKPQSSLARFAI